MGQSLQCGHCQSKAMLGTLCSERCVFWANRKQISVKKSRFDRVESSVFLGTCRDGAWTTGSCGMSASGL